MVTPDLLGQVVRETIGVQSRSSAQQTDPEIVVVDEDNREEATKASGSNRRKVNLPKRLDTQESSRPARPTTLSLTQPRTRPTMTSPPPPLMSVQLRSPPQKPVGLLQRRRGGLGATSRGRGSPARGAGGSRGLPALLPRPTLGSPVLRNILTSNSGPVPLTPGPYPNGDTLFRAPPPPPSRGGIRRPPPSVLSLPDPVPTLRSSAWPVVTSAQSAAMGVGSPRLAILYNREREPINHLSGIFYCNGNLDNMVICCDHSIGRPIEINLHTLNTEADFASGFQFLLYQLNSLNSYYYHNMCSRVEYLQTLSKLDQFCHLPQFRASLDDFRRIWAEMTPCAVVRREQTRENLLKQFELTSQYEWFCLRPSEHVGREVLFYRCKRCDLQRLGHG